jgi:hypothetical protein
MKLSRHQLTTLCLKKEKHRERHRRLGFLAQRLANNDYHPKTPGTPANVVWKIDKKTTTVEPHRTGPIY